MQRQRGIGVDLLCGVVVAVLAGGVVGYYCVLMLKAALGVEQ
jgi:hypothetical protein